MNKPCVGFLEFNSIIRGIKAADSMLKKATVRILMATTVSSGKYILMFDGEVDEVKSSFSAGKKHALDSFVIPNMEPAILQALNSEPVIDKLDAIGMIETSTCASCIESLDIALKTASVSLLKIHLAKGIAGKAYFVINGEMGDVEAAIFACSKLTIKKNTLVEKIIIPRATTELLQAFHPPLSL